MEAKEVLQEFIDYFDDMRYLINDELRAMLERAEEAVKNENNGY